MPLHRELDGGGAEDGLGALPRLQAQVPEVQMFTDGACYFQAAQGAPPPRYDVKPLDRCIPDPLTERQFTSPRLCRILHTAFAAIRANCAVGGSSV